MKRFTKSVWLVLPLTLVCALASSVHAESQDPRIGEWREGHNADGVGLYMIYEDLGNGVTRTHSAENLAASNRLHEDTRCDGKFYPRLNAAGAVTDVTVSCTILDGRTVKFIMKRQANEGWVDLEGKWVMSDDGKYSTGAVIRKDRDGKVVEFVTRVFTRNAENCLNHDNEALFRACAVRTTPPRPAN